MQLVAAAIKTPNGMIYTGRRHYNIFNEAAQDTILSQELRKGTQGFIDEEGNFYNREEAKAHAIAIGQIQEENMISSTLTSEDLW